MTVIHGDCIEVMAGMDPESVDAIVTDPPYGLEFMGKEWDKLSAVPERDDRWSKNWGGYGWHGKGATRASNVAQQEWHQQWAEAAYRVAKPSAYLLAFGGTRTVHRMTVALEDAGWSIRDMLVWAYASGFPKSKASLKPAWEPIVMARKPGPLRDLAIDACRIPTTDSYNVARGSSGFANGYELGDGRGERDTEVGRWPANVILTDPIFDGGIEGVVGGGEQNSPATYERAVAVTNVLYGEGFATVEAGGMQVGYGDSGTYSRFFLIPKADRADREPVLGGNHAMSDVLQAVDEDAQARGLRGPAAQGASPRVVSVWGGDEDDLTPGKKSTIPRYNVHPTVKPTDLMRHLVRLVTPTGGLVLDPFLGSGTTGLAAEMEGFEWVGIEREAEYVAIAEARLNGTQRGLGLPDAS
jgi:site-specific DNA-methyltransferase (adenine-specific)